MMQKTVAGIVGVALALGVFGLALAADPAPKAEAAKVQKVAVKELSAKGIDAETASTLSEVACTDLGKSGAYQVLCPGDILALLAATQQAALMGGCDDAACNEQLSKVLDAPLILSGTIGKVDKSFVITLSLIDAKSQNILKRASEDVSGADKLLDGVHKAVASLLKK